MNNKKEFHERALYKYTNYFYWFLMGNIYFALLNIPLLFLLFFSSPPQSLKPSILEVFLCCLPIGPAFTALLGVMGKLIREKHVNITRDFFRMYKMNFKQSSFLWIIELVVLTILYIDIKSVNNPFRILFIILFVIVFLTGLYIFPIISRFHVKTKDVIIFSFIYLFKHFKATVFIMLSVIFSAIIFSAIPSMSILFIASLQCYCIMYFQNDILKNIENKTY